MTIQDIVSTIEGRAPLRLQESWDISGWQATPVDPSSPCSGVMLCLDVTPAVVAEASAAGCNLIVSHHPLLFKAVRSLTGATPAERAIMSAIARGIDIYSSHTALDNAPFIGVSYHLGEQLGLIDMRPLAPNPSEPMAGTGIVGRVSGSPLSRDGLIAMVKDTYAAPRVRVTQGPTPTAPITTVALCSGSGGEFIPDAIAAGAQAYITSDVRYHDFLDHGRDILIIDTGHFESEICTKSILSQIISQKFPNFAVRMATSEHNPVVYA